MRYMHDGIMNDFYTRRGLAWLAEDREVRYCRSVFLNEIWPTAVEYDRQNDIVNAWVFKLFWGPGLLILFLSLSWAIFGYTFTVEEYWCHSFHLFIYTILALKVGAKQYGKKLIYMSKQLYWLLVNKVCYFYHEVISFLHTSLITIYGFLQETFLPIANEMCRMYVSYDAYNFW